MIIVEIEMCASCRPNPFPSQRLGKISGVPAAVLSRCRANSIHTPRDRCLHKIVKLEIYGGIQYLLLLGRYWSAAEYRGTLLNLAFERVKEIEIRLNFLKAFFKCFSKNFQCSSPNELVTNEVKSSSESCNGVTAVRTGDLGKILGGQPWEHINGVIS